MVDWSFPIPPAFFIHGEPMSNSPAGISTKSMPMLLVKSDGTVKVLEDTGNYAWESEVIKNALMSLFREHTELNVTVALELYKKGEVTLSKAAEIAGMTTIPIY